MSEKHFKLINNLISHHQFKLNENNFVKDQLLDDLSYYEEERFLKTEQERLIEEKIAILKLEKIDIESLEKFLVWYKLNGDNIKNNFLIESLIKIRTTGETVYGSNAISFINLLRSSINKGYQYDYKLNKNLDDLINSEQSSSFAFESFSKPENLKNENDLNHQIKEIRSQARKLKAQIKELTSVVQFSKTIDNEKILAYTDGYIELKEAESFDLILQYDNELKEKIELQKKFNSYSIHLEDDHKELDPAILKDWIRIENNQKKNKLNLAKLLLNEQNLFIKIKEWITFRPIEFGFAGLTSIMIGSGLMYGTTTAVVASNPAIIQVAQLSNYSTTSIMANVSGLSFRNECLQPSTTLNTNEFNNIFNLKVYNPITKTTYNLSDNDQTLLGNQIQLFFKTNLKGKIFIDILDRSNTSLKCKYINIIEQQINTVTADFIKIGNTLPITEPLGKDKILVKFKEENEDQIKNLGIFSLTTISTDKLEKDYLINQINLEKSQDYKILPKKEIYQLHSNIFKKELYKPFVQSWGNNEFKKNKFERVFIDFDGDDKAEIVAIDSDKNGFIDSYVIDRNNNAVIDAVVFPLNKDGKLAYDWLIDENEDGKFDGYAEDLYGNWQINKINDL